MQQELFHEDFFDALRTCVQALGGAKRVGCELWPELPADKAGNRLRDALDSARREKLSLDQLIYLLKAARKVGCHAGLYYLADACDYHRPEPLEPRDEMAELQRAYIESVRLQKQLADRMQHFVALREVK